MAEPHSLRLARQVYRLRTLGLGIGSHDGAGPHPAGGAQLCFDLPVAA